MKFHIAILALLLVTAYSNIAVADDFDRALAKIDEIKPNIDYNSFCSETPGGEDKIACRIKAVSTIGLLVCKKSDYAGVSCKDVITTEINNLTKVQQSGLKTVDFKKSVIDPLKCVEEPKKKDCAGYLVRWVEQAKFVNLDDTISAGEVAVLANDLVKYIPAKNLPATRSSIEKIISFMAPERGKYSRICDLQGFFLKDGGFLVNDVPGLDINVTVKPDCGGVPAPTYDAVLEGLQNLVRLLK
ncbi:MAG: hypothetical protein WC762_02360 [Methylobacter sp.]|jgi:hypothetical protein